MMKVFYSDVPYKLLYVIIIIFYLPLIFEFIKYQIITKRIIGIFIFVSIIIFCVLYTFFNTKYIIKDNHLIIMCGFFKYASIDVNNITEINNSKSLISAPAPSFDRIKISYNKYDNILISPSNKVEFISHLLDINSKIIVKIYSN